MKNILLFLTSDTDKVALSLTPIVVSQSAFITTADGKPRDVQGLKQIIPFFNLTPGKGLFLRI